MANPNAPQGLQWIGDLVAGQLSGAVREYAVASDDTTALFIGDPVKSTGTALTLPDGVTAAVVTQAAAGDTLRGVVVGFKLNPNNLNITYGAASTLRSAFVVDSPYAKFVIQSNGTGVAGDVGANADVVAGSGNTTTGISGFQLDESTVTTGSAQLRILEVYPIVSNTLGANVQYVVEINEHEFKSTTGE